MARPVIQPIALAGTPLAPAAKGAGLVAAAMKGDAGQPPALDLGIIQGCLADGARKSSPHSGMSLVDWALSQHSQSSRQSPRSECAAAS